MRSLGTSLILIALVAVQVPFVTCHSDCRSDCLPLWAFEGHHCHDAEDIEHERAHDRGCTACERPHGDPAEDGEDHGPGDHELVFASVSGPASASTGAGTQAWDPNASVALLVEAASAAMPAFAGSVVEAPYLGPPGRPALETVRLLL